MKILIVRMSVWLNSGVPGVRLIYSEFEISLSWRMLAQVDGLSELVTLLAFPSSSDAVYRNEGSLFEPLLNS